jgi:predicted dehydrogenase
MWRGGVIGFGNVAVRGHLPGWQRRSDVDLVAVADVHPRRRGDAAAQLPGAAWHDSAAALLSESALDFVDICTPPATHRTLIEAALARGLHVLCEKPLVGTLGDLRRLAGLAAARRRALRTVHNWHAAPIVGRTHELIADGAVGEVTSITWHTLRTRPAAAADDAANWRVDPALAGGGVLTDHGWHVAYIVQRWTGQAPLAVSACLETRRHHAFAVEDTASLQVTFPAAKADIFLTWAADARGNRAEIGGTTGVLHLRDDTIVWQSRRTGEERRWSCPPPLSDGSQHPEWFDTVAADFVAAMAAPDAPSTNLTEAWWCAALEAAARASSRDGGRVTPVEPWRSPGPR